MPSVERTAYPRFNRNLTAQELSRFFTPTEEELALARAEARGERHQLCFLTLLKCFQRLHDFPVLGQIPAAVVEQIREHARIPKETLLEYELPKTFYRHCRAIREYLGVHAYYGKQAHHMAVTAAYQAAQIMDQSSDVINSVIDELFEQQFEFPAYSALQRVAERINAIVQRRLFQKVFGRLTPQQTEVLDHLLVVEFDQRQSAFNLLKKLPQRPSRTHLEEQLDHLDWLESLGDVAGPLEGVPATKIRSFANRTKAQDASDLRDFTPARRYTMLLCLIHRMRVRARDDVGEMFIKRMATIHKRAKEERIEIHLRQRERTERLMQKLDEVAVVAASDLSDAEVGRQTRSLLDMDGGLEKIREECAAVQVWNGNNHLALLWPHYRSVRFLLFRLVRALSLDSTTQDRSVWDALNVVLQNENRRAEWISGENIDLSFASERWLKLIRKPDDFSMLNRRQFEVCVFSYLAADIQSGDICIAGSESFADHRQQLLPWQECEPLLKEYCGRMELPDNAAEFTNNLRTLLTEKAVAVDQKYPQNGELTINGAGEPVLSRVTAREIPQSALTLQANITQKMPTRNLPDILVNIEHWTNFTRHFGPLSGSDPKIERAAERYIQTVFAIGCNLGPHQAARHMSGTVSAHMRSFVNRRHITVEKLEAAQRELIELYLQLDLPKAWGDGKTIAADGTQYDFYEENLLAGYHFRYRKMGAVAYRHVANNYIAVFCRFIPPGVWEAIYVIDGLINTQLSVQPDTVHADTQGQSTTVFAFTYLTGINLMPRIRNWKDLTFFRPGKNAHYQHIDTLFTDTIDWDLIETHWQDLMQVALSIKAGKISSSMLLRKLGHHSRKNRLFLASQELGRVIRTLFLLEWISNLPLRQQVTGTTNKIESYNGLAKWLSFGGEVIAENDPDEQQKHLRYNDLVATAVILQNAVDMTRIIGELEREGRKIPREDLSFLSPYQTSTVKRFGEYVIDINRAPEPWVKEVLSRFKVSRQEVAPLALVKEA